MEIEKKAKPPLEKRIEIFCDSQGQSKERIEELMEEVKDREDIEDDEEAFERAISEIRRTVAEFIQITPGKTTFREGSPPYYGFFARVFEGEDAKFRRVRFYPDDEEELDEMIDQFEVGSYHVSDSIIKLQRRNNEAITDNMTDNQIYGIKGSNVKEEPELSQEQLENTKMDYIDVFGIENDDARDKVVKQETWADLLDVIQEYETVKIGVFQTLNFVDVSDRETPDGQEPKPRLRTKGQVERRGEQGTHDIVIYFDKDADLLEFKEKHNVPFKGIPQSAWIPSRETEDGEEVDIIGSTGMPTYNVKNVEVVQEKDEFLSELVDADYYYNVGHIQDPTHDDYIEPDPAKEGTEFHGAFEYPYMMIDATNSGIQSNDQPRLNLTIFDEDMDKVFSGKAYGATAYDIADADTPEEFLENVEALDGSVAKNVKVFGARSSYENDEGETVSNWITYGVHYYEQLDEDELAELNESLAE